jgi:lactobin A/cerein 7B family class IIb bacteriocin
MIITSNTAVRELSKEEVDSVPGGAIPLAVAVFYVSGSTAGAGGGWAFGTTLWK